MCAGVGWFQNTPAHTHIEIYTILSTRKANDEKRKTVYMYIDTHICIHIHAHIYVYTYICVCMYIRIHYTDKIYAMKSIRKAHVVKNNKVRHTLAERNIMQVRARSLCLSRAHTHTHTYTERGGGGEGDRDSNMLYAHKHTRSHHNTCVAECWHRWCGMSTLQHIACRGRTCIDNNTLQNHAAHFNTLQHTTTHCKTLRHTATHYNTLQLTQGTATPLVRDALVKVC